MEQSLNGRFSAARGIKRMDELSATGGFKRMDKVSDPGGAERLRERYQRMAGPQLELVVARKQQQWTLAE